MPERRTQVLLIAGSDSSGGAGLQADLRVCAALDVHPLSVVSAVTAQGARGVTLVRGCDPELFAAQLTAVEAYEIDAIKIGLVPDPATAERLARWLAERAVPVVLDPVFESTSGQRLVEPGTTAALLEWLAPRATVITPNHPECETLTGRRIRDREGARAAARALASQVPAALVTGGHGTGDVCEDVLVAGTLERRFVSPRRHDRPIRGTGCALASALAVGLARGLSLEDAAEDATRYVQRAVSAARPLGGETIAL